MNTLLAIHATISGANFFFINPKGIIFGPNAQIDVSGAFIAGVTPTIVITDQAAGQIMGDWAQGEFQVAGQTAGAE